MQQVPETGVASGQGGAVAYENVVPPSRNVGGERMIATPTAELPAPPPLTGAMLWVTALALALGTFMQVLDGTIANVALPTIAGDLGVSSDSGTWVITSFACANGVTVPLTGWLMSRFGVVRTFVVAVLAFTVASFLCATAWSLPSLVVFRILQGACSGPLIPGSQALLIAIFPSDRRSTALAVWAVTTLVGPVVGPVLGGYISDNYHWGWIFLINVPVGLVVTLLAWRGLAGRETPRQKLPVDVVGLVLLTVWVFSLQTMLDLGKDRDWFNSSLITGLAACAGVSFAAWLIWESTDSGPAVDLSLFRRRNFALSVVAICLGYGVFFANNLLLPLWLQEYNGYTATWAGLVSAPSGVLAIVATMIVTRFKADPRIYATACFLLYSSSYWFRSGYTPDATFFTLTFPLLLQGVAMSMFFVPLTTISFDGLPQDKLPSASGIANFARIIAGSFAASLATTYWDRREALHQTRLTESATAFSPMYSDAVARLHALGANPMQSAGVIAREVTVQAYLLSSLDIFRLSAWLALAMIPVVWLCKRPAPVAHVIVAE
jgi:DHA2 family multidrug resistance protein